MNDGLAKTEDDPHREERLHQRLVAGDQNALGELFDLLSTRSLLARTLTRGAHDEAAFRRGVDERRRRDARKRESSQEGYRQSARRQAMASPRPSPGPPPAPWAVRISAR